MKKIVTAYNRLPDKCTICKTPADEDFCPACIEKYPEKIEKIKIYWNLKHHTGWQLLNKTTVEYPEPIVTYLRAFREIKRLFYSKKEKKWPVKALKDIKPELRNIYKQGFLYINDIGDIMAFIEEKIKQGPKKFSLPQAIAKEKMRPLDISLNLLIFLLAKYTKHKRSNTDWQKISIFLKEEEGITIDSVKLRERHKKVDKKKLRKQYEVYRCLWAYPHKDKQHEHLRDIHLPEWKELLY